MLLIKLMVRLYYEKFNGELRVNFTQGGIGRVDIEERGIDLYQHTKMEGADRTWEWFLTNFKIK